MGLDSCAEEGCGKQEEIATPIEWGKETGKLLFAEGRLRKQLSLMCIVMIGTQAPTGPSTPRPRMQAQCLPSLLTMLKANLGNL